jgi:alpha-beta hydrolase superfamily lysophospholipase
MPGDLVTDAAAAGAERNIPGLTPSLKRRLRAIFRLLGILSPALAARLALRLFLTPRARRISAQEAQFLSGAASRRLATARGDVQLYEWPGAGPTVLVVHGWISHAARLSQLIEALRARGLRVAAFDAPAHGRSSGRQLDLPGYSEVLSVIASACAPIGAVLAHSFGALTAMSWLAQSAQAASVKAAVLIGLPRDVAFLLDTYTTAMDLSPKVNLRTRALLRERFGRGIEDYCAAQLGRQVHVPVLLVHGGADEFVPPAHSEQVAQSLVGARLMVAANLNHSGPLRDPASVNLMADFVADRVRG